MVHKLFMSYFFYLLILNYNYSHVEMNVWNTNKKIGCIIIVYIFGSYKSYPLKNNLDLEICKKRDTIGLV
jgi:hypothetical protein